MKLNNDVKKFCSAKIFFKIENYIQEIEMKHTNGHHHIYIFLLISSRRASFVCVRFLAVHITVQDVDTKYLLPALYVSNHISLSFVINTATAAHCEVWIALNISWHKNDVIAHWNCLRSLLNAHSSIKYLSPIKINFHAPFTCSLAHSYVCRFTKRVVNLFASIWKKILCALISQKEWYQCVKSLRERHDIHTNSTY